MKNEYSTIHDPIKLSLRKESPSKPPVFPRFFNNPLLESILP